MLTTLDIVGAILGLIYILLEYRASIWLWVVSIIMPLVDMFLYFNAGLYADFGMAIYYALAAVYGFLMWLVPKGRRSKEANTADCQGKGSGAASEKAADSADETPSKPSTVKPITHFPRSLMLPTLAIFLLVWGGIYLILILFTNSTVPVLDSFTSALSIIALWALAQKYVEQWLLWIVVDAISCALYVYKGIPFKASLYGLYVVIAVFGYSKWRSMATQV